MSISFGKLVLFCFSTLPHCCHFQLQNCLISEIKHCPLLFTEIRGFLPTSTDCAHTTNPSYFGLSLWIFPPSKYIFFQKLSTHKIYCFLLISVVISVLLQLCTPLQMRGCTHIAYSLYTEETSTFILKLPNCIMASPWARSLK